MYLVNLIKLVIARKNRKECQDLKVDAAYSPVVHFVIVVAIGQKTLWWPIPPRADVLSEGRLRVNSSTRAKISKFYLVFFQKNVLSTGSQIIPLHTAQNWFKFFTYGFMSLWNIPFLCMWSIAFKTWYM